MLVALTPTIFSVAAPPECWGELTARRRHQLPGIARLTLLVDRTHTRSHQLVRAADGTFHRIASRRLHFAGRVSELYLAAARADRCGRAHTKPSWIELHRQS